MEKKQLKIPGFIFGIIGILIACIIFLIFVQVPFSKKYSTYETSHASAAAEIQKYNDYLSRADQVQASIDSMKKKYEENIGKLTVNSTKSAQDIRDMLKKLDYDLSTLSVAKGVVDAEGRTSSTGDPLYSTSINFTFTASYQKCLTHSTILKRNPTAHTISVQCQLLKTEAEILPKLVLLPIRVTM